MKNYWPWLFAGMFSAALVVWVLTPPPSYCCWNITVTLNESGNSRKLVTVSNNVTHAVFMTNVLITAYEKPL